eukprot:CAMPEP_0174264928 /NCGR_PEP_ID=MMETSP0439-20130205/24555_1 /TAXON_ID=0 /ORGANISM="Stereomyxa ramosa, Strain Chinc5" /LENGTH=544 /DNA_ID=CAMNT_0015351099 /DNA_START=478 /DNA_END=2112 /DNA_ORIENTATION=-
MLEDTNETAAKKSLDLMIELYRKQIWKDARTVNVISSACFSKSTKIKVAAFKFFINSVVEEEEPEEATVKQYRTFAGRTRKRKRKIEAAQKSEKKARNAPETEHEPNWPALELINDPQGFGEKLLGSLKHSTNRFEVKIMLMNLISRLIASHKILLLNFYSFIQRYIQPHQEHITIILALVAQSVHSLIPPETLEPLVTKICNSFIDPHCSPDVIAIGINTVREICARQPWCINQVQLHDITSYRKSRNKGIMMAARSMIGLFRTINPHALEKKDRGKFADMKMVPVEYGEQRPEQSIKDIHLLDEEEEKEENKEKEEKEEMYFIDDKTGEKIILHENDDNNHNDTNETNDTNDTNKDTTNTDDHNSNDGANSDTTTDSSNLETNVDAGSADPEDQAAGEANAGEPSPKKIKLDALQILSDEQFKKIEERKLAEIYKKYGEDCDIRTINEFVDPIDIQGELKKKKMNKEERLDHIKSGRDENRTFGRRSKKKTGGSSNKEKAKNTPFMMAIQSKNISGKRKLSLRQKQKRRRKAKRRKGQKVFK